MSHCITQMETLTLTPSFFSPPSLTFSHLLQVPILCQRKLLLSLVQISPHVHTGCQRLLLPGGTGQHLRGESPSMHMRKTIASFDACAHAHTHSTCAPLECVYVCVWMSGALSGPAAAVLLQVALDLFTYKQVRVNGYAEHAIIPNVTFAWKSALAGSPSHFV